ncbi:unnamed protein product [Amoebophrya sp. A25]|nr:unnamed protein product [Amoebophrya sp. A25]|eukprot:GSA25T00004019001.1
MASLASAVPRSSGALARGSFPFNLPAPGAAGTTGGGGPTANSRSSASGGPSTAAPPPAPNNRVSGRRSVAQVLENNAQQGQLPGSSIIRLLGEDQCMLSKTEKEVACVDLSLHMLKERIHLLESLIVKEQNQKAIRVAEMNDQRPFCGDFALLPNGVSVDKNMLAAEEQELREEIEHQRNFPEFFRFWQLFSGLPLHQDNVEDYRRAPDHFADIGTNAGQLARLPYLPEEQLPSSIHTVSRPPPGSKQAAAAAAAAPGAPGQGAEDDGGGDGGAKSEVFFLLMERLFVPLTD